MSILMLFDWILVHKLVAKTLGIRSIMININPINFFYIKIQIINIFNRAVIFIMKKDG